MCAKRFRYCNTIIVMKMILVAYWFYSRFCDHKRFAANRENNDNNAEKRWMILLPYIECRKRILLPVNNKCTCECSVANTWLNESPALWAKLNATTFWCLSLQLQIKYWILELFPKYEYALCSPVDILSAFCLFIVFSFIASVCWFQ